MIGGVRLEGFHTRTIAHPCALLWAISACWPSFFSDRRLARLFSEDAELLRFLGPEEARHRLKDKGQRKECGCIVSKDIGACDTCPHLCRYCYATSSLW